MKAKFLTKNTGRLDMAFQDIKRIVDSNAERETKVLKIEQTIAKLYESEY